MSRMNLVRLDQKSPTRLVEEVCLLAPCPPPPAPPNWPTLTIIKFHQSELIIFIVTFAYYNFLFRPQSLFWLRPHTPTSVHKKDVYVVQRYLRIRFNFAMLCVNKN